MPFLPPDVRIARHLDKIRSFTQPDKIDQVLDRCGLTAGGDAVRSRGGNVTDQNCYEYKQALKSVVGEMAYSFAKVNFVLAGCKCPDCR